MTSRNRRFGSFAVLYEMAVVAALLGIVIPVASKAFVHATRHGATFLLAALQATAVAIALTVALLVLLPLVMALTWACYVKLTNRRAEPVYDLLREYWCPCVFALFGVIWLVALVAMAWDQAVVPVVRYIEKSGEGSLWRARNY